MQRKCESGRVEYRGCAIRFKGGRADRVPYISERRHKLLFSPFNVTHQWKPVLLVLFNYVYFIVIS
jgi:hypothetical protein